MKMGEALLECQAEGDFTIYRYLKGASRAELENKLGFHRGRMDQGAIIATIYRPDLLALTTADFTLGASSRWSRSSAAAPWAPEFTKINEGGYAGRMEVNAIESALALRGQNVDALKQKILRFFQTGEHVLPAKVFPLFRHEDWMTYPSAEVGVPQFKLHKKVHWVIKQIVAARAPLSASAATKAKD